MTSDFMQFQAPTRIVAGRGLLADLSPELVPWAGRRAAVLVDPALAGRPAVADVLASLAAAGIAVAWQHSDIPPDSDAALVHALAERARDAGCDLFVAVGGGSVIDTAKAVNLAAFTGEPVTEFLGANLLREPLHPLIAIPTTVGTGAEVTAAAVIADRTDRRKLTLHDRFLTPDLAVLDPAVTDSLPPPVVAATAMDALTHAIEAYTGLQHSPFADMWAAEAGRRIVRNVVTACGDAAEDARAGVSAVPAARAELQLAAAMAGIAFNHSMVGVIHAMAHALGGMCGVAHGVANSIMLCRGLRYNMDAAADRIAAFGRAVLGVPYADDREAAADTIAAIAQLQADVAAVSGLPTRLSAVGVRAADLDVVAARALEDGTVLWNPREVELDDVRGMLASAL